MTQTSKYSGLSKFLMLLGVLVAYFGYLSWQYDLATGGLLAVLTWSFFVLCTPIADAGFLIDFPVRLIAGLKMIYTELIVWVLAIGSNLAALTLSPDSYDKSFLTRILHKILTHPMPYWSIIILCAGGTFLSVGFGDQVVDAIAQKRAGKPIDKKFKKRAIGMGLLFVLIIGTYYHLIETLNIQIPD